MMKKHDPDPKERRTHQACSLSSRRLLWRHGYEPVVGVMQVLAPSPPPFHREALSFTMEHRRSSHSGNWRTLDVLQAQP